VSTIFEKSWWATLPRNKRDRPELGTVSMQGITAYPTVDREGDLYHDKFEGGWKIGRPHNIEAFRNIDPGQKHLNPGYLSATGEIRPDAGILSVERKVRLPNGEKRQKTVGVANALPLNEPFFRLNQKAQTNAYLGTPKKNANRTAHMWTAGDLSQADLDSLISGEKTPQQILGMRENMILGRNAFGDAMMSWQLPDGTYAEAPRLAYEVYDTINPNLPHHLKWKRENRIMRPDVAPPFREDRGHSVSGSVDPLLRIPLWMVQHENPQLVEQSQGKRYVEWVNPRDNTRFEGIPVPLSITGDYEKPFVSRGVSTGTHGLYFDPRDMTGEGMEMWQNALSGDIFQLAWESLQIDDESTIKKMPHPSAGDFDSRKALPTAFRLQGVKNNAMYSDIMEALRNTLGDREMVETFGGGGGLSLGFKPTRAIINDINPDIGNLMRRIIREPMQVDTERYNVGQGEPITIPHKDLGDITLGNMTPELMSRFGEGNRTWIPAHYYNLRNQYAQLRQKAASGTATPQDYDHMAELFYMLQLTGFNSLVRYGRGRELPSWDNPYSTPPGTSRSKDKIPPVPELEDAFFSRLREEGLYDPEKNRYKGRIQPGGNAMRAMPLRGGGGIHDFTPWHQAMKDWEWRTGNAFDFYEDIKDTMSADKNLITFDPPYFGEEGAHGFFNQEEQERLLQQIIDAKERGIPTVVFNSMHPSIVNPLRDAGFHIEELGRKDMSGSKASTRGTVGELMAMANIDQDAFSQAWDVSRGGKPVRQPNLSDF
jgi:site-specific DNA-adenine methylase